MLSIEGRIKELIEEVCGIAVDEIESLNNLKDDLGLDDLDLVELFMNIETEFGTDMITEEKMADLKTVEDVIEYVKLNKSKDCGY